MPRACIHLEKIKEMIDRPWEQANTYGWGWNEGNQEEGRRLFMSKEWGNSQGGDVVSDKTIYKETTEKGHKAIDYDSYVLLKVVPNLILGRWWDYGYGNKNFIKGIRDIVNECNCESENNQQLVLRRNVESELSIIQGQRDNLQSSNWSLQSANSSLQTQLDQRSRDIEWGQRELARTQRERDDFQNRWTISERDLNSLQQSFNNLTVENNNKSREIEEKRNEIRRLKGELNLSQEEILNQRIRSKEGKWEVLIQQLGLNRGQIINLRDAHEDLNNSRQDYNRTNIRTAENNIDNIKAALLNNGVGVDNVQRINRKCERLAELRLQREQVYQQQYEARQEVPPRQ